MPSHSRLALAIIAPLVMATLAPAMAADAPITSGAEITRATLSNGLRIVVVRDRLAPVVATELNYLAGSNDAPPGFPGTAHALEHMMFRGSTGLERDQLAEVGALLGGQYNADTTETVTQYTYTVPAADLGVVLHSEALRMAGLTLSQADWDSERGAIEQEVSRDLSSPFYRYMSQAQAILFAGTPYEHDALGTRDSFDKTDAALLRQFYERWYAPNNAILVISGDIDPQQAITEAQTAFGAIPSRPVPEHAAVTVKPVAAQTLTLATDFPVGLITLAYQMPGLTSKDFAAADVLGDVLGSDRGALYGLVPAGRALSARFSYEAKQSVGFGLAYAAFPTGADPAPIMADLKRVLADAAQNGVPPELVEAAKRQEVAQLAFEADSISGLSRSWSRALAFQGLTSPDDLASAYSAVTVDDVNRLAREILDPDHALTAILTPERAGQPAASKGFGGAESFGAAPDHPVTLPDWAQTALASLHLPAAPEAPDISVLPNGLRLIVQPEHVSPTVSVYGSVRENTDIEEPAGQEGVAALTDELFGYGSQTLDRLAFRKAIDDIAARESAGSRFSLRVLAPQFAAGMKLLADNELHPALPEDAFAILRRQLAQRVGGQLESPDYLFSTAANKAIVPPSDPTLRQATPETIEKLTPADVTAYLQTAYRPDLTTIVVVGDITPDAARQIVASSFGAWHADGPTPMIDLPPIGPSPASSNRIADPGTLQDSVLLTETITAPVTSPDRYTLMLGNVLLGSGFSSRLYQDLRVKTGYVYNVNSSLNWTRTRADYSASFGADPDKVAPARTLLLRDLRDMQTTPVSDAALNRAKAQVLRQLPMGRASIGAIAGLYLRLVDLGLPMNAEEIAAQRYMEITAAQIKDAFAKWVRPEDLAEVIKGP